MVVGIQIVGLAFVVFMLYLTFLHFKRKEFSGLECGTWIVLWLVLAFITLFPTSLNFIVKNILSMKRPLDFYIISGFLFVILLTFFNYSLAKKNNKQIEIIVRKLALNTSGPEKPAQEKAPSSEERSS